MTDGALPAGTIPRPPSKSIGAWGLDILVWGGILALLIYSIGDVDLVNIGKLFSNAESTRTFARELLRPDFTDWRIFVEKMWETVQIALWGTFIAVFAAVPMGLAAARNVSGRISASPAMSAAGPASTAAMAIRLLSALRLRASAISRASISPFRA